MSFTPIENMSEMGLAANREIELQPFLKDY